MAAHQAPLSLGFSKQEHWSGLSFSNVWKWKVKVKSLSSVWLLVTPWTAAYQAPPSMGFSRQEYWSGVPLPSPLYTAKKTQSWEFYAQISICFTLGSGYFSACMQIWLRVPVGWNLVLYRLNVICDIYPVCFCCKRSKVSGLCGM